MDPNAALDQALALSRAIVNALDSDINIDDSLDGAELAELILALDHWITKGGFLPARWERRHE